MAISAVKIDAKAIASGQEVFLEKRNIIEAAARLFSLWGVDAVSIRDISKEIGTRPELIYTCFLSKEQLVQEMYDYYRDRIASVRLDESLLIGYAREKPAQEIFDHFLYHFSDQDEALMSRIIQIAICRMRMDENARKLVDDVFVKKARSLEKILKCLLELDKIKPVDIEACMNMYRHMSFSVSYNTDSDQGLECSREQWQKMIELFFSMILKDE